MADPFTQSPPVTVIGVLGDNLDLLSPEAKELLHEARIVVGGRRHLELWAKWSDSSTLLTQRESIEVSGDIDEVVGKIGQLMADQSTKVCLLASGDPGFFGIVRSLTKTMDRRALRILPAPSSVSLAFARLGLCWDDAVVVSAHGRPLSEAVNAIRMAPKAAVLTSPDTPPEAIGKALIQCRSSADLIAVCGNLGFRDEAIHEVSLEELATGQFDPLAVLVLLGPGGLPLSGWDRSARTQANLERTVLAWGLPETAYVHRQGMITKSETRSVVLGKLELPPFGVLWDVGAGSGSVGIECALVSSGLSVFSIESSAEDAARIGANANTMGVGLHVINKQAPEAFEDLPDPDRVFVGGGGLGVLEAATKRLRPGGTVVATFAALDRAAKAADLLGNLVQVGIDRGEQLPDGSWRLGACNPVFVVWGPRRPDEATPR